MRNDVLKNLIEAMTHAAIRGHGSVTVSVELLQDAAEEIVRLRNYCPHPRHGQVQPEKGAHIG